MTMETPLAMIGPSPLRKEDRRLLTGAGRYLDDLQREGMLHLGVVRSVQAHARLLKIQAPQARALAGVIAVWSAADLPEITKPIGTAITGRPFDQPVLARSVARYAGEPVAVVVAESAYRVADALELVEVEYDPLPPAATLAEGVRTETRPHEGWPDNAALSVRGAVGETEGALAYRDRETGALVVWSSHQNPYRVRDAVATILGLPVEGVRVVLPDVGGAFGPKGSVYGEEVLVAAATLRLGRPVKWVETRREDFLSLGHDRDQEHEARIGFTRDGTIVALEDTFLADVGAYPAEGAGLTANTVNHLPGPYRVPNYKALGTSIVTTKTVNAAYRGAGRPEAVFVMERLMDLGARRLGLDPAELRRRNLVRPEEMPYRPGLTYKDGVPVAYDPGDFPRAFERALALLHYDEWRKRQKAQALAPRRIGVGLACYAQGTGLGPFEGALVRVDPSGKVYVLVGVTAQGQGHATTLAQIAAAELGAAFEDVSVGAGDTTLFPFGMGTGGS